MNKAEARTQLDVFLAGKTLTFTFETFPSGEWVATCNEIPGIVTGGVGDNSRNVDQIIRSAIVSAAGISTEHTDVLRFVSVSKQHTIQDFVQNIFGKRSVHEVLGENIRGRYVLA